MTALELIFSGLAAPANAQFQEAMRPELQRRMLELSPAEWEQLASAWPEQHEQWCMQLCDTLSPSRHGRAASAILYAMALDGPDACVDLAIQKLDASQALNPTEKEILRDAIAARGTAHLGRHAALQRADTIAMLTLLHSAPSIQEACEYAMQNREALAESMMAACYYCQTAFASSLVSEFADGGETALCPYCGTDAVLPSAAGYAFTPATLQALNEFWFH